MAMAMVKMTPGQGPEVTRTRALKRVFCFACWVADVKPNQPAVRPGDLG